jgi:hypothetical protein
VRFDVNHRSKDAPTIAGAVVPLQGERSRSTDDAAVERL